MNKVTFFKNMRNEYPFAELSLSRRGLAFFPDNPRRHEEVDCLEEQWRNKQPLPISQVMREGFFIPKTICRQ
jgi:hypothetical protein